MKKVAVGNKYAVVDDADFGLASQYTWHLSSHGYAVSRHPYLYMHRLINKTPIGSITDHINRDTLDNRQSNLRTCDKRVNSINRTIQSNNKSGHKGISWNKDMRKWETYIWNYGKKIMLGFFADISEAVMRREKAEKVYHAI